jgi:hypothetical protein
MRFAFLIAALVMLGANTARAADEATAYLKDADPDKHHHSPREIP